MSSTFKNILSNKYMPIAVLLLASFTIVYATFYPFFSNDYLLSSGGDGLKHYYSLSYFVKYGQAWDFEGMAYPYGEHFMFMDGHGILGKAMNWFNHQVFDISDYSVGILHFWLFGWLIISPIFLFKVLQHFDFKPWEAVIAALLIFSLSPQWHRFFGHQSLTYLAFIPMLWWFLINITNSKKRWIWAVLYGSSALFFGWIHPYYLPLAAIFALAYMVTSIYENGKFNFHKIGILVLTAFIPMVIFQVFMASTAPFSGERGYVAGGFFQYMATFEGVFIPNFGKYFDFWQSLTGLKMQNPEAFNYVGFSGQISFIVMTIIFLKKLFKRQFNDIFIFCNHPNLNQFLQAGFLILLFSFALIFQWFPILLEKFPVLRQFRSLGRFGWIFYYIFTVFTAYQIKSWLANIRLKNYSLALGLGICLVGIWAIEGYQNIERQYKNTVGNLVPNHFSEKTFTEALDSINKNGADYQAIIPAPGFHVGSDKLAIIKSGRALAYAFRASYEMELPVAGYYSSRVPLEKSFEVLRWFSDDLTRQESEFELYNDKPFLIISSNARLGEADNQLLAKAELIYKNPLYNFYELDINKYKRSFKQKQKAAFDIYTENRDNLYKINAFIFSDKQTNTIFSNLFDEFSNIWKEKQPFGNKNYFGRANQHVLFDGKLAIDSIGQDLEVSVWVYSNEDLPSMPILKCETFNEKDELIEKSEVLGTLSTITFGRWVRISMIIKANEHRNRIYLGYYNNFKVFNCWADNFLIRSKDVNVWEVTKENQLYYNGYFLSNSQ